MGQCDDPMQSQVETASEHEAAEMDNDVITVLKIIKHVATGGDGLKRPSLRALQAWKALARARQHEKEELLECYKQLVSVVDACEEAHVDVAPVKAAEKSPKCKRSTNGAMSNERGCLLAAM